MVNSGNGTATETPQTMTEYEMRATDAVETDRTVEGAPEKEFKASADLMFTELTPSAETTVTEKVHSPMASKVHSGTVVAEVKEHKETKPVADHPTVTEVATAAETTIPKKKWPGWPGDCVFRVIVPVLKVYRIIGRNGDLIKRICEETKANICILEGHSCDPNRIVQISGKEDTKAPLSPAMNAVIRVFKHVNGLPENEIEGVAFIRFCSIQLLLTSMQALSLIGRMQGSLLKTIQENTGCSISILSCDEVLTLSANPDDRVVDLHGEALKVVKALEAVDRYLRMFFVDSILPLPENTVIQTMQIQLVDVIGIISYTGTNFGCKSGAIFTVHESRNSRKRIEVEIRGTSSQLKAARLIIQAKTGLGRVSFGPIRRVVDQIAQTMQIPLADAVRIIIMGGINFGCTNGAIFILQDSPISHKRVAVEIRGPSSLVQAAQQLIQARTGHNRVNFGKVRPVVDQALTQPGPTGSTLPLHVAAGPSGYGQAVVVSSVATGTAIEPQQQKELMVVEVPSELPQVQPVIAIEALTELEPGEATHEPQAAVPPSTETSPPSATTKAPVEPQKEPIMCSSMVEVPLEMRQVQPATALVELETQPASEVVAIGNKRSMSVFEEEMLGVFKMIADNMNKPEPPPKPTFEDCENKLNELGWPKHDPLNLVALTIFCDENDRYRELWMKLQPERCANWVRMIGRSKRFT